MKPLISIVVPVYNAEKSIHKCIESILQQSYENIELLLIDDGSTDKSGQICDEYSSGYEWVYTIHIANAGVSNARNVGLEKANGDYCVFVDSDDWIESKTIELAVSCVRNVGLLVWGYSVDFVDNKGTNLWSNVITKDQYIVQGDGKRWDDESLGMIGYVWNKLYRIDIIRKHHLKFDKSISLYEDLIFNIDYILNVHDILFSGFIGTHYIQTNDESLGTRFYSNIADLKQTALEKKVELLRFCGIDEDWIEEWTRKEYGVLLRASINSVVHSRGTEREKKERLVSLLSNKTTASFVRRAKMMSFRDLIIFTCVRNKCDRILYILYGGKR